MIVPRSFAGHGFDLNEKSDYGYKTTRSRTRSRSNSPFSQSLSSTKPSSTIDEPRSNPVRIPSRNGKNVEEEESLSSSLLTQAEVDTSGARVASSARQESVHGILSSTTIPVRRKVRGRASQRLPKFNHVADFSRLMQDDIRFKEGSPSRSVSSSYVDALFGNIDGLVEGQMIVGSGEVDENTLATRSISSDSLASLASPEDYGSSGLGSFPSSLSRSSELKRTRQLSCSQDCAANHPLMPNETEEKPTALLALSSPTSSTTTPATTERKSRSFKSSLTASLKAIKSAAQSVSSKATLFASQDSEAYLARSFFDIQPFLTDDKRPPPGNTLPSPQLRRYLNPYSSTALPDSPAQLHFWQDERHSFSSNHVRKPKSKSRRRSARHGTKSPPSIYNLPPVVQLSTCLPPSVRTANASSPPIWLNPDGTPSNKQTALSLLQDPEAILENTPAQPRHREPRENRDFLRIFVCEMEMRRHGKLSDDTSVGRARLWLPPVADDFRSSTSSNISTSEDTHDGSKHATDRWTSRTMDDL